MKKEKNSFSLKHEDSMKSGKIKKYCNNVSNACIVTSADTMDAITPMCEGRTSSQEEPA